MTVMKLLFTALIALTAGWFVESAKADEAYVCEGGRIVYVKMGQLERLKREDSCIAGYYGLTVDGAAATAQSGQTRNDNSTPSSARGAAGSSGVAAQEQAPQQLKVINANESGRWFTQRQAAR